jgi:L-carnitine CoA-transferase
MKDDKAFTDFGSLAGVRVVSCGSAIAGPFAPQLMAEWGAEVIWVESPKVPDMIRAGPEGLWAEGERRNQRNIALDLQSEAGQQIFLELLATAEILVENSRGGQFDKFGLTDARLWEANPSLVIAHVSGFGQTGVPEMVKRSAYDPIAQAFGCFMQLNGSEGSPPMAAVAQPGDYYAGLFALGSSLAALLRARATGQGESIDIAMFEVLMRAQGYGHLEYLNLGRKPVRRPERPLSAVGIGTYQCGDGGDVYFVLVGAGVLKNAFIVLGIADPSEFISDMPFIHEATPAGQRLEPILKSFCLAHTAKEVEEIFSSAGVPCSRIYDYEIARNDPHYQARNVFIEWDSVAGNPVQGVKVVPEFTRRPGRIWRGAATQGMDNEAILSELGIGPSRIAELYETKAIGKAGNG